MSPTAARRIQKQRTFARTSETDRRLVPLVVVLRSAAVVESLHLILELCEGAIDLGFLSIGESRQKTIGCGGEPLERPVVECESAWSQCDANLASVFEVGFALDEASLLESFQNFRHSTRGAPQLAMELAWTECVGSAGISQSRENAIVARCEFEGFEDVVLDSLDQGAQPHQANDRPQTRELELRIFSLPAARKFVDPVQRNPPITRPAEERPRPPGSGYSSR